MADYKKKKKRNFKRRDTVDRKRKFDEVDGTAATSEANDPAWYAQYPELMRDAASIPYSIPTGTRVSWDIQIDPTLPLATGGSMVETAYQSVPGILTLGVIPTVGISTDATSPVNVAAKLLYTKVRSENSGARNYDSPDLLLYCLAMDQVYSLITWYNRIYGKMMLYSQVNRYLPKALLNSELIDFDDMILHINDFKAFLDTATAQAAAFSVPADIKLFNRHAFMYQNIYKDAESPKSQIYQFAPRVFYTYDEYSGAGRLVPVDLYNLLTTLGVSMFRFQDLVALFHMLMDPIIASEDFNIMSGDILKAFGEGNIIKLGIMPPGYVVVPVTDYEVLTQIKNATMTNYTNAVSSVISSAVNEWSIHQDANNEFIVWNPRLVIAGAGTFAPGLVRDRYLSTYKTTPEPSDNMVYTRLMFVCRTEANPDDNTKYDMYFDSVGSEFVCAVVATQFHEDALGVWKTSDFSLHTLSETYLSNVAIASLLKMFTLKHYDYSPAAYIFVTGYSPSRTYYYPMFDLDNWTIVHAYELEKMHRTAIMSMLRVPMIGSALGVNNKK